MNRLDHQEVAQLSLSEDILLAPPGQNRPLLVWGARPHHCLPCVPGCERSPLSLAPWEVRHC